MNQWKRTRQTADGKPLAFELEFGALKAIIHQHIDHQDEWLLTCECLGLIRVHLGYVASADVRQLQVDALVSLQEEVTKASTALGQVTP